MIHVAMCTLFAVLKQCVQVSKMVARTDYVYFKQCVQVLKKGHLHKTSQSRKPDAEVGPTRPRRFRLTPESLEYFQQFSHVSTDTVGIILL